jgi:SAM-dependent methyltransferase
LICPACASDGVELWRTASASDPHLAAKDTYMLARCSQCGTALTVDAGDDASVAPLYEGGRYRPARRLVDPLIEPLRRMTEWDRMRYVARVPESARVLEVGSGDGRFLARLAASGYAVLGIEPSPSACRQARDRGVRTLEERIEDAGVADASQDAVIMWHVLEHLADPAETVRRAHAWLAPGGRLIVAVPNIASVQARIGGDRWFHQDVPRHRSHFTDLGLRMLLERTGFRVERISHLLLEQNPLGMWQTLLNRLTRERQVAFRFMKRDLSFPNRQRATRDLTVTALAGPLLVPIAVVLELAAGLARRGGSVVVEALPHD